MLSPRQDETLYSFWTRLQERRSFGPNCDTSAHQRVFDAKINIHMGWPEYIKFVAAKLVGDSSVAVVSAVNGPPSCPLIS